MEDRPGEGKPIGRAAAKESLGRTFVTARHEGELARGTEYTASRNLEKGLTPDRPLANDEIEDFKETNKVLYESIKNAPPEEIRDAFKRYN